MKQRLGSLPKILQKSGDYLVENQRNTNSLLTECMEKEIKELIRLAYEARTRSYSPYSGFATGAALLAGNGQVFQGCNVENAAYSPTMCAERNAFFKAVSEGIREFKRIAVVGGYPGLQGDYCAPCGVCRQVMMEFCDPETFEIILARGPEEYQCYLLKELLPRGFGPGNLKRSRDGEE